MYSIVVVRWFRVCVCGKYIQYFNVFVDVRVRVSLSLCSLFFFLHTQNSLKSSQLVVCFCFAIYSNDLSSGRERQRERVCVCVCLTRNRKEKKMRTNVLQMRKKGGSAEKLKCALATHTLTQLLQTRTHACTTHATTQYSGEYIHFTSLLLLLVYDILFCSVHYLFIFLAVLLFIHSLAHPIL